MGIVFGLHKGSTFLSVCVEISSTTPECRENCRGQHGTDSQAAHSNKDADVQVQRELGIVALYRLHVSCRSINIEYVVPRVDAADEDETESTNQTQKTDGAHGLQWHPERPVVT